MEYTVLARRYRPKRFADLVGQQAACRALARAVAEGRLAHAYLLAGIRGVGKTTIARILAMAVNCEQAENGEPCNACASCQAIAEGRALDVIEMDAASHTGVDDIRELIENAQYPPAALRKKVFIIDEAHMLSKSAFNALLKTLEEPPAHLLFVLATTEPERIPPTVRSRCQRFDLRRLGVSEIAQHLASVLEREGIEADAQAVAQIARAANGSLRDALSITDRVIAFAGKKIDARAVAEALGLVDAELALFLSDAVFAGDGAKAVRLLRKAEAQGIAPRAVLEELVRLWRLLACAIVDPALVPEEASELQRNWLLARRSMPAVALDLRLQVLVRALADFSVIDEMIGAEIALLRLAGLGKIDGFVLREQKATDHASERDPLQLVQREDWPAIVEAYGELQPRVAGLLQQAAFAREEGSVVVRLNAGSASLLNEEDRQAFEAWLGCPVRWEMRRDEETVQEHLHKRAELERVRRIEQAKRDPHLQNLMQALDARLEDVEPAGKAEDER